MRHRLSMRRAALTLAAALTAGVAPVAAQVPDATVPEQCADFDPSGTIAKVAGDFELTTDPNDPAQHLIYLNHVANGPSDIVVAQVDGVTAQTVPNTLTTIADNFYGLKHINGPEFVMPPGLGLGVLYRDLSGVHGVFRPATPKAWNDFSLTVDGQPAGKNPPRLSSSYRYSYETGNLPFAQNTYTLFKGPCELRCYASVLGGSPTDAAKAFKKEANLTIPTIESVVQSERDYVIYADACTNDGRANGVCSLYEATIDLKGGFQPNSIKQLIQLPTPASARQGRVPLDVAVHPATQSTVFAIEGQHEVGTTIDFYERKTLGAPLNLIASVPANYADHYRLVTSTNGMILHYLVRPIGSDRNGTVGSYVITVNAVGQTLQVGTPEKIADVAGGAEVEYVPAAKNYAVWFQTTLKQPIKITRCFFQP